MTVDGFKVHIPDSTSGLSQDEEYCVLVRNGTERKIRFHDYDEIYRIPGLYEYLFYDRLECTSHHRVSTLLVDAVKRHDTSPADLKVLELGAGNGLVGEALTSRGIGTIVGADILEEAAEAAERDRPNLYADYFVEDFCALDDDARDRLQAHDFNCFVCVAALGFGDIPPEAFAQAFNLVADDGWVAFNIKEDFVNAKDSTGFARLIRRLIDDGTLEIVSTESYRHRLSSDGEALNYVAIVGRKHADIPDETLDEHSSSMELHA